MGEGIDESFIFGFLLVGPVFVLCYYHFFCLGQCSVFRSHCPVLLYV